MLIFKVDNNTYCICLRIKIDEFFSSQQRMAPQNKHDTRKFEQRGIYIYVYTFVYTCCIAKVRDTLRSICDKKQSKLQKQINLILATHQEFSIKPIDIVSSHEQ